jgi:hypothetical protein
MHISPDAQRFSEVVPLDDLQEMSEEFARKTSRGDRSHPGRRTLNLGPVTATGSREHLHRLQNDLRKAGYKKI